MLGIITLHVNCLSCDSIEGPPLCQGDALNASCYGTFVLMRPLVSDLFAGFKMCRRLHGKLPFSVTCNARETLEFKMLRPTPKCASLLQCCLTTRGRVNVLEFSLHPAISNYIASFSGVCYVKRTPEFLL